MARRIVFALIVAATLLAPLTMTALSQEPASPTPIPAGWPVVPTWNLLADGFERPVHVADPGDGSERLFVVEQAGLIRIIEQGEVLAEPFLDIVDLVGSGGERGLLSVAFYPDFAANGAFFVDYTDLNGDTVVARYEVSADNPNRADPDSATTLLMVDQPAPNHNGGLLLFGPDGMLYVGMGDGGGGNGPNAQDPTTLLGKILRLNVDVDDSSDDEPYAVPPDNPFVGEAGTRPEIWVSGLRNPWRFSFDRETGDLYIGDVGGGAFEEISLQFSDSGGGENFGWPVMEGTDCRADDGNCEDLGYSLPIAEYAHGEGDCVVTGGYVYRGADMEALRGRYLFADYCSGRLWNLQPDGNGAWIVSEPIETELRISSFGEGAAGELYVVDLAGAIYRLSLPGVAARAGN